MKLLNTFKQLGLPGYMGIDNEKFDRMIKEFVKEVNIYKTFGIEMIIYARKIWKTFFFVLYF